MTVRQCHIYHLLGGVALLLSLLAGCSGGGESHTGKRAGTSVVHIQIGRGTHQQLSGLAAAQTVTPQHLADIPPDVTAMGLRVSVAGVDIQGSPLAIPLSTGVASITIDANIDHLFRIEARNLRGDVLFQGEQTVNLPPNIAADIPIALTANALPPIVVASQPIAAVTGGVVVVNDVQSSVHGLRLTIPPGALTQDTTLTVAEVYNPSGIPALAGRAGVLIDLGADGTTFTEPVTITYPYDASLVQALGLDAADLRLFHFDAQTQAYVLLPGQVVDTQTQSVQAETLSFSLFALAKVSMASIPSTAVPLVSIDSPAQPVVPGALFTVPVLVNAGDVPIVSYLFELAFDPTVLAVTAITAGPTPFEVPSTNAAAFASGKVRFAAHNPTFTPTSGALQVAHITLQAIGPSGSASDLILSFPSTPGGFGVLVDDNFTAVQGITFAAGRVTLQTSAASTVAAFPGLMSSGTTAPAPSHFAINAFLSPLPGDIDADGDRDSNDVRGFLEFLVTPTAPALPNMSVGDVNADGILNNLDSVLLLGVVQGQLPPPPDQIGLTVVDNGDGTATVAGLPGVVVPGSLVLLSNVTTGTAASVTASASGYFQGVISAVSGDTLSIEVNAGLVKTTVTVGDTFAFMLDASRLDDATQLLQ